VQSAPTISILYDLLTELNYSRKKQATRNSKTTFGFLFSLAKLMAKLRTSLQILTIDRTASRAHHFQTDPSKCDVVLTFVIIIIIITQHFSPPLCTPRAFPLWLC